MKLKVITLALIILVTGCASPAQNIESSNPQTYEDLLQGLQDNLVDSREGSEISSVFPENGKIIWVGIRNDEQVWYFEFVDSQQATEKIQNAPEISRYSQSQNIIVAYNGENTDVIRVIEENFGEMKVSGD